MTPRSLFIIIVRVLGFFMVEPLLYGFAETAVTIAFWKHNRPAIALVFPLFYLVVSLWLGWLFVFRAPWVVKFFRLDRGFAEEQFTLTLSAATVMNIAIIAVGGFGLVRFVPNLCGNLAAINRYQSMNAFIHAADFDYVLTSAAHVIIAILLLACHRQITAFIVRRSWA